MNYAEAVAELLRGKPCTFWLATVDGVDLDEFLAEMALRQTAHLAVLVPEISAAFVLANMHLDFPEARRMTGPQAGEFFRRLLAGEAAGQRAKLSEGLAAELAELELRSE